MFQTEPCCRNAIRGLIRQLLATTLSAAPDASHIDLYAITERHRQPGRGLLQYSLAASVCKGPSVSKGQHTKVSTLQDQKLTDWADFGHSLRAGRCRLLRLRDIRPSPIRDRFSALEDSRILICPVIGPRADLLGAVCLGWSGRGCLDAPAGSASMTAFLRRIADQVARVMDLYAYVAARPTS